MSTTGLISVLFLAYLAVAAACLRQWNEPNPWSRIDVFSGGFLLASPPWLVEYLVFMRGISRSKEVLREASGAAYDPSMLIWINGVALAELTVFLDYGHWHLAPALSVPALQSAGLALWVLTPAWLLWADRHLARHFSSSEAERHLLTEGPFHYVRHPRYAGLLVSRAAFALLFASPLAWLLSGVWVGVVLRHIRLEDAHLAGLYGAAWESYAARTSRLVPGLY